jgi:hypothetical protein
MQRRSRTRADASPGRCGARAEAEAAGPTWQPSWVRGGGGRNREGGGKYKWIDPIFPVEEPAVSVRRLGGGWAGLGLGLGLGWGGCWGCWGC